MSLNNNSPSPWPFLAPGNPFFFLTLWRDGDTFPPSTLICWHAVCFCKCIKYWNRSFKVYKPVEVSRPLSLNQVTSLSTGSIMPSALVFWSPRYPDFLLIDKERYSGSLLGLTHLLDGRWQNTILLNKASEPALSDGSFLQLLRRAGIERTSD